MMLGLMKPIHESTTQTLSLTPETCHGSEPTQRSNMVVDPALADIENLSDIDRVSPYQPSCHAHCTKSKYFLRRLELRVPAFRRTRSEVLYQNGQFYRAENVRAKFLILDRLPAPGLPCHVSMSL